MIVNKEVIYDIEDITITRIRHKIPIPDYVERHIANKYRYNYKYELRDGKKIISKCKQSVIFDILYKIIEKKDELKSMELEIKSKPVSDVYLPASRDLINLIEFRLDAIHSPTVADYNVVNRVILLCKRYNVPDTYTNTIKERFKEFKL